MEGGSRLLEAKKSKKTNHSLVLFGCISSTYKYIGISLRGYWQHYLQETLLALVVLTWLLGPHIGRSSIYGVVWP